MMGVGRASVSNSQRQAPSAAAILGWVTSFILRVKFLLCSYLVPDYQVPGTLVPGTLFYHSRRILVSWNAVRYTVVLLVLEYGVALHDALFKEFISFRDLLQPGTRKHYNAVAVVSLWLTYQAPVLLINQLRIV
jgi:hypothetical protein